MLLGAEPGAGGADGRPLRAQAWGQRAAAGLAGRGGDHAAGHGALGGAGEPLLADPQLHKVKDGVGAHVLRELVPVPPGQVPLLEVAQQQAPRRPGHEEADRPWPDTSKRMAVNAAANRALLETQVIHIDLGCYKSLLSIHNNPKSSKKSSEAGQRHVAEEPGAPAGHPAEPRSDLCQLPGA